MVITTVNETSLLCLVTCKGSVRVHVTQVNLLHPWNKPFDLCAQYLFYLISKTGFMFWGNSYAQPLYNIIHHSRLNYWEAKAKAK